jgi:hypothetical protein
MPGFVRWVILPLAALLLSPQAQPHLQTEMQRLQIDTAMLLPSQAIDERLIWSPDSRFLAVNIRGTWHKLNIEEVSLQPANWHGKRIGAITGEPPIFPVGDDEMKSWAKPSKRVSLRLQIGTDILAEMKREGLSTSLVLTRKGNKPTVLWKSDLESCEGLAASPNNQYLAYICETNGVFVTDLAAALPR